MDPVTMLRDKVEASPLLDKCPGIYSVIMHVQQAENLYNKGKQERDSRYFTDAIYRANHAFEGILKEAYSLFTGKDPTRVATHLIESHLLRSHILVSRVVDLLKNYRQNWRNPSTHDHTLFFGAVEAFVAVLNVATFVYVLVDQMIERIAYDTQKAEAREPDFSSVAEPAPSYGRSTFESFCDFLTTVANQKMSEISKPPEMKSEVLGIIRALLESNRDVTEVLREPAIGKGKVRIAPDMLVRFRELSIVVEIGIADSGGNQDNLVQQIAHFGSLMQVTHGALLLVSKLGPFDYRIVTRRTETDSVVVGVVATNQNLRWLSDHYSE